VDFSGDHSLLNEQLEGCDNKIVRVVRVRGQEFFNKARAQNIGAFYTSGRVIFFCDCDIVVNPEEIVQLACEVDARPGEFATLAGIRESTRNARRAGNVTRFGYQLHVRIASGRELHIVDSEEDAEDGTRQAPGLLMVRREHFLTIDGYNGRLHGWGWEDQDMIARLTLALGLTRIQRFNALHISHDDAARIANYPPVENRWYSRDRMFRQALALYDVADFQGTYSDDASNLEHCALSEDN
jgi:predicted glycosyltransferase involved in capsule biosynthesis